MKATKKIVEYFAQQRRDSRYIFILIISCIIFIISSLQILSEWLFANIESPIFHFFNDLPRFLNGFMLAVTQFGGLGGLLFWIAVGWYLVSRRAAMDVFLAGIIAWCFTKTAKGYFGRGRPLALLDHVHLFSGNVFSGNGFPSGHATIAAACVTILYYQVPKHYRKYMLLIVIFVGVSRMYLGAHFPLDVLGGWALGTFIASAYMITVNSARHHTIE